MIVNNINNKSKRTCRIVDFAVTADHRVKLKESEKKGKYLDLARELKKTMEHEGDADTNFDWCDRYNHQRIDKGMGGLGNERTNVDHPNINIIKIDQNTKNSPGDLRRLAITQTPVRNYQLTLSVK